MKNIVLAFVVSIKKETFFLLCGNWSWNCKEKFQGLRERQIIEKFVKMSLIDFSSENMDFY